MPDADRLLDPIPDSGWPTRTRSLRVWLSQLSQPLTRAPYHRSVSSTDPGTRHAGAVVALEHVTKSYGRADAPAVNDLSLTVPAGEICVLVGPSGCGKTTTMKMINRLIEPTSGRITIDGDDVHVDARRSSCAERSATSSSRSGSFRT